MEKQTQLAAIMFTDIVGYTRLMGTSEEKALSVLQQNRAIQKPLITKFNGRFIKELGDGTMASFSKASDAVRCAMEMQKATTDHPDLNLRIGIHMGEVLFEDGDVFGDTVNIAARIESAGKQGAVFISGSVYGAVHNKDDIQTRFVEQMQLKNVNRPIDIYEVAVEGNFQSGKTEPAVQSEKKQTRRIKPAVIGILVLAIVSALLWFTLGDGLFKPKLQNASIAVLPFKNMSSDAENENFSDGITEDLLTQLSKLKNLKVISRTSVMHFKNSDLTIPEIAKKLGVEYIVEGSVRKVNNQVAITAQLIHAEDDRHIWAENYQRNLDDVFAIQREVTQEITHVLNLQISMNERSGLEKSETENLEAYQLYLKGKEAANDRSENGIRRSIALLEQAVELDPEYVTAKAELAYSILLLDWYVYDSNADSLQQKAKRFLDEAMLQDSTNANIYVTLSDYYDRNPDKDNSIIKKRRWAAKRAVFYGPNNAYAYFKLFQNLTDEENYDEALKAQEMAYSLDPYEAVIVSNYFNALANVGRIEEARNFYYDHSQLFPEGHSRSSIDFDCTRDAIKLQQWDVAFEIARDLIAYEQAENIYDNYFYWTAKETYPIDPNPDVYPDVFKHYVVNRGVGVVDYVYALYKAGRLDEAKEILDTGFFADKASEDHINFVKKTIAYVSRDFEQAVKLYGNSAPNEPQYIYCLIQLGKEKNVREMMAHGIDTAWTDYENAMIYTALGENDRALDFFEKVEDLYYIEMSRIDQDLKPLWSEPRYQAKIASYNFPPLKGDHVYNK